MGLKWNRLSNEQREHFVDMDDAQLDHWEADVLVRLRTAADTAVA